MDVARCVGAFQAYAWSLRLSSSARDVRFLLAVVYVVSIHQTFIAFYAAAVTHVDNTG